MWIDRGFEQVHERGNTELHRLKDPAKWVPYGVGAIEGQVVDRGLPVLEAGAIEANGATAPAYGPGEEPARPRARRPRRRTTSPEPIAAPCGRTAIRLQFEGPRAAMRGRCQWRRRGADKGIA